MARAFDSTPKKLATPVFALFYFGWTVFTAGFGLLLNNEEDSTLKEDPNSKSPLYFPYYMTLVGANFVGLLGLLHAALPSGIPSSIVGALFTVLNTIYFVSVGYVINTSYNGILNLRWEQRWEIYYGQQHKYHDPQLVRAVNLMLAGSIILTVSWGLVQLLSQFYEHCPQAVQTRNLWCVVMECWKNHNTLVRDVSESVRISSIPAMLLSAVGWCVFLVGVYYDSYWGYTFGGWSAIFVAPLMYLASLLQIGYTGKASTLMGIFASILNTFFVVGMGFSVTYAGKNLYEHLHQHFGEYTQEDNDIIHSSRLILAGGAVCLIFWTVVLVLWPFYRPKGTSHSHTANSEINYDDYDNDLLLPASSSVTIQPHITDSQEYTQQPHMEEHGHCTFEGEAGNV